jgi:adenosylcobinamide-GDP ribazoletransferase
VDAPAPGELGKCTAWFPVVGVLLGTLVSFLYYLLLMGFGPPLADVGAVLFLAYFTGALHLDGLADTFDGLFGGATPEERLRIMKDPHHGTYGIVAVAGVLLVKAAALATLPLPLEQGMETLLREKVIVIFLMPVLGRWAMVLSAWLSVYPRPEGGLGRDVVEGATVGTFLAATPIPFALCLYLLGGFGAALMIVTAFITILFSLRVWDRIGGMTGDTLGAVVELLEACVPLAYMAVTGIWRAYVFL